MTIVVGPHCIWPYSLAAWPEINFLLFKLNKKDSIFVEVIDIIDLLYPVTCEIPLITTWLYDETESRVISPKHKRMFNI